MAGRSNDLNNWRERSGRLFVHSLLLLDLLRLEAEERGAVSAAVGYQDAVLREVWRAAHARWAAIQILMDEAASSERGNNDWAISRVIKGAVGALVTTYRKFGWATHNILCDVGTVVGCTVHHEYYPVAHQPPMTAVEMWRMQRSMATVSGASPMSVLAVVAVALAVAMSVGGPPADDESRGC